VLSRVEFDAWVAEVFDRACELHGPLGLKVELFATQISGIAAKYYDENAPAPVIWSFLKGLHTDDLYLALACACHTEASWVRFDALYRKVFQDICRHLAPSGVDCTEFRETVWTDLFFPDRTGRSRIGSYDGRSSLPTWLRAVASNRMINEVQRKHWVKSIDPGMEPPDRRTLREIELTLEMRRFEPMIVDCLSQACRTMSRRERLIITYRFTQGLQLGQIAKILSVHQSTVTRQMDRLFRRLRDEVARRLATQYKLEPGAVEECLAIASDAPLESLSLLNLIVESAESEPKAATAEQGMD
jgi:RNA polymerase sigma-70 factor, ECF subfamily